ncbi:peptidoglycan-binding domain-containing protein, partial [Kiloniella sp.]|uniref:peptidoglycan-binding domain-containing protein n=1 Tax=Kiloniella sp. TaxID=1938587 RepID=UPI003B01FA5A
NNLKAWVWLKQAAEGEVAQASRVAEKVYTRLTPQEIKQLEKGRYRIDFDSGSDFADMPTVLFTQYRLGKLGYELGPVDGLMGSKTQEAINSFVRERNLNIPEVISEALLEELRATF